MQNHQHHRKYGNIILLYAALFLFLLLASCTTSNDNDPFTTCCSECLTAFSKSPAGVGPAGAICGSFLTAATYSDECTAYFGGKHVAVAMCQ